MDENGNDDNELGTPKYLLARTTDPETSHISAAIFEKVSDIREFDVLQVIRAYGDNGCISDQVQEAFGFGHEDDGIKVSYSAITGRYIALERKCYIERDGEQRLGFRFNRYQQVMRALSEEERAEKLFARETDKVVEAEVCNLLDQWWEASEILKQAQQVEMDIRNQIIEKLFSKMGIGKFKLDIGYYYYLVATIQRRKTKLEIRPFSKKETKKRIEDYLMEDLNKPVID